MIIYWLLRMVQIEMNFRCIVVGWKFILVINAPATVETKNENFGIY